VAPGKKPRDPLLDSDIDFLIYTDQIEAIGQGVAIEPDNSWRMITPILFGRVAKAAVENSSADLRQGMVGQFRKRALNLAEMALAEACLILGGRSELEGLLKQGDISAQVALNRHSHLMAHHEQVWRNAASHCALILRDIEKAVRQKGTKGRPPASRNGDQLARLLDFEILDRVGGAARQLQPKTVPDRNSVAAAIPAVVRELVRLGQLRRLGETEQESVDRHSKRLRVVLDGQIKAAGGSSIIRKAQ